MPFSTITRKLYRQNNISSHCKTAIDFTIYPNAKTNAIYQPRHSTDIEVKCGKIVRHLIDKVISVEWSECFVPRNPNEYYDNAKHQCVSDYELGTLARNCNGSRDICVICT